MPKLKYVGPADVRTISVADFKRVGVDDQTMVHLDVRDFKLDPDVVEVSEKAARYLLEKESTTWVEVEVKDEEAPEPKDEEAPEPKDK